MTEADEIIEYIYIVRFGGRLAGVQEFLESLASEAEEVIDSAEIKTIESITDSFVMTDATVPASIVKVTPPYHWTSGAPVGKWNESEWS